MDRFTRIISTDGIRKLTAKSWNFKRFVDASVARHINHDWGDTPDEDKELNEQHPDEAMSTYVYRETEKIEIWVKSENGDIIVLLPCEY